MAKAGLRNAPLLAFERWRFASKWAEDEPQLAAAAAAGGAAPQLPQQPQQQPGKQKQKQQAAGDPVIPFGSLTVAAEPGLVSDLTRAGVDVDAAIEAATQLAGAAAAAAAAVIRKRQQLASGKAVSCGDVLVEFHKHSLDLMCDGMFVKVSKGVGGNIKRAQCRQHQPPTVHPVSLPSTPAIDRLSTKHTPGDSAASSSRVLGACAGWRIAADTCRAVLCRAMLCRVPPPADQPPSIRQAGLPVQAALA